MKIACNAFAFVLPDSDLRKDLLPLQPDIAAVVTDDGNKEIYDDRSNDDRENDGIVKYLMFHQMLKYDVQTPDQKLSEREFLRRRDHPERKAIDEVGKNIDIGHEGDDIARDDRPFEHTGIVCPEINDHIHEIDNKPEAKNELGVPEKITAFVCDREIDLTDAKQDDQEKIKESEVGFDAGDTPQNKVFFDP
jgi:hypothetical protein